MASVRQRELFDIQVLELLNQGKSDEEIALILGKSKCSVGDSRRRQNHYKIQASSNYEEVITKVVIVEHVPKAHPYIDQYGKLWLDVSEFFGV